MLASSTTGNDLAKDKVEQLKREVARAGVAKTVDGVIPGLVTLAAPVFTTGSSVPLAVALTLPKSLSTPALLETVTAELLSTTRRMTAELGGSPPTSS